MFQANPPDSTGIIRQIKLLYMSGYTDDAVVRHGLLTAEVECLSKPFSLNSLISKVRQVLNKPAANR